MKRAMEYESHDGERFATRETCKAHEQKLMLQWLVGLTDRQVESAVDRSGNIEIADAIEFAGNLIAQKRRADGDVKRKRKETPTDLDVKQARKALP